MRRAAVAETPWFFVYGSLMRRYGNFNRFLRHKTLNVRPAYCQGFLYHLPIGFPGLITLEDCQDLVVGELMSFKNPVKIMRALDQLEGFHPDNLQKSLYIRKKLPVIVETDPVSQEYRELEAWVYTYPLDHLSALHQKEYLISCGNWKLLCEQPLKRKPGRIKNLYNKLRHTPVPEKVHIDPAFCMDEKMLAEWKMSTGCARFCKNPGKCLGNRRKMWDNFSLADDA